MSYLLDTNVVSEVRDPLVTRNTCRFERAGVRYVNPFDPDASTKVTVD